MNKSGLAKLVINFVPLAGIFFWRLEDLGVFQLYALEIFILIFAAWWVVGKKNNASQSAIFFFAFFVALATTVLSFNCFLPQLGIQPYSWQKLIPVVGILSGGYVLYFLFARNGITEEKVAEDVGVRFTSFLTAAFLGGMIIGLLRVTGYSEQEMPSGYIFASTMGIFLTALDIGPVRAWWIRKWSLDS